MRIVLTAATFTFAAAFIAPAFAQNETPAAAPPAAPAPVDAEAVKKAEAILNDSAKAYASAKALTDTITFTAKTPQGDETQTMKMMIQGDAAARLILDDMTFTAVGGSLYAEKAGIADRYAQFEPGGDIAGALENELGFAPPQFAARKGGDTQKLIDVWTFSMLPMAKITDLSMAKNDAGEELHSIVLAGQGGTGAILINAKTLLLDKVTMHMKPEGAPPEFEMDVVLDYEPKAMEAIVPAIAFDAGARQKVSSIDDLKIDLAGKPAPDFTLETLEGTKVTLSELKGNVVVLDFWATWCGPCKRGLPMLSEFAKWAKDNNPKVKVFAVDVWERGSAEDNRKNVTEFWTKGAFAMPTLMDVGNVTAKKYGFDSIPATFIIGPDGNIFVIHSGFDPNGDMVADLKKNVEDAFAAAK